MFGSLFMRKRLYNRWPVAAPATPPSLPPLGKWYTMEHGYSDTFRP